MLYLKLSNFKDKGFLPLLKMCLLFRQETDINQMCHMY